MTHNTIDVSNLPRHRLCLVCLDRGCADGGDDGCKLQSMTEVAGIGAVHVGDCQKIAEGKNVKAVEPWDPDVGILMPRQSLDDDDDEERTTETPIGVAADLLRSCRILVAVCLFSAIGCATAATPLIVEAPRDLAPSETHVSQAPVHETTDLASHYQAIDSDVDAAPVVAADAGGDAEKPEIEAKGGALKMGETR